MDPVSVAPLDDKIVLLEVGGGYDHCIYVLGTLRCLNYPL
jgi:hypothetical protein